MSVGVLFSFAVGGNAKIYKSRGKWKMTKTEKQILTNFYNNCKNLSKETKEMLINKLGD